MAEAKVADVKVEIALQRNEVEGVRQEKALLQERIAELEAQVQDHDSN